MHKITYIFTFTIFLLTTGCQTESKKQDNTSIDNQPFLEYLEKTFNIQSTIDEKMFLIIPCSGCSGCEQFIYKTFTDQLVDNENFSLIICKPVEKGFLSPTLYADNVKYDFKGNMSEYDFGYGYPSCIIVKDNVVVSTYSLSPDIIHWMGEYLNSLSQHTK
ncbi:MAG: hypothetical protein PHT77_10605 [Bacteroidales bacterium]|jgi:thioredoxin-related protein|nr:hypothetical protein [Bacteroidales bacterium]MDD3962299.1 hypothetical protein [Bacteroidales bacterium]